MMEKTRKKNEISIGEAADVFGIPRIVIDVRHEGSHRDLPSLQLVRIASIKALDWLVWYYWEPQEKAIPTQNNLNANLRKEIKRKLQVMLGSAESECPPMFDEEPLVADVAEEKFGSIEYEGPPIFDDEPSSLYSIGILANALDTFKSEHLEDSDMVTNAEDTQTAFDDCKSVVLKLSRKEPEYLITLTQVILEKMESNETTDQITALTLSHLTGNISLLEKLKKLALLEQLPHLETNSVDYSNENLLSEQENCIRQAAEDFEFMKQHMKGKCGGIDESEAGVKRKWTVTKSWNSCPIGMLPSRIAFSGQLLVLDCADEVGEEKETISGGEEDYKTSLGKREADVGAEKIDCRPGKKLEIEGHNVVQNEEYVSGEGSKGWLLIDEIWRKVGDEELFAISSAVKLLV
ncbi:las1-like family protein [Striga hermonthica]|uniref:Las1-like family protein n=1 Tax=Striga hermonthica TaxID=68872 RepID=A0A9N7NMG9_STRHE|nr:las1-like family protein [Striga hermonthica]